MTLPAGTADLIQRAFAEDLAEAGDITTRAIVDPDHRSTADIVAREAGCIAGLRIAGACFAHIDPEVTVSYIREDGDTVDGGGTLATVSGRTVGILTAERVALNMVGRLSGIASLTRAYVDAVAGTGARITDTRRTTPGLRAVEKYAVSAGGGRNHRFGLYDAVLIEGNHIAAEGSILHAVRRAREAIGPDVRLEVEVDTLVQLADVLETDADAVLLVDMPIDDLAAAVEMVGGRIETEASGGIDITTVRAIAETGVDAIAVAALTDSAPALDVGLEIAAG